MRVTPDDFELDEYLAGGNPETEQSLQSTSQPMDRLALDSIYQIAKTFSTAPDPIDVVPEILNILSSFLDLRHGVLALLAQPDAGTPKGAVNPYTIAATAFERDPDAPLSDIVPDEVVRIVFRSGVPFISFNVTDDFGVHAVPARLRDEDPMVVAVPIRDLEHSPFVLGVLCVFQSAEDLQAGNSEVYIRVLTMVASLLEQALQFRHRIVRDRDRASADARRALQEMAEVSGKRNSQVEIDGIVGDSPAIKDVIAQVKRVAGTKTPVLLRGESGTGKELFARAVHSASERNAGAFIRVNCAALSETLLESELFGHEKGAFTSANAMKKGRFELADGGTLFLDEIGEISPTFQTKLLRVLQEGEFERVGGTKTIKVDVRIVAATNKDLERCVAEGTFRADLYFRICVVPIILPPLRDRKSDILPLAQLFLDKFNKTNGTNVHFAADAFDTICRCNFPGNVRELENCVNRAAALSDGDVVPGAELACHQNACLSTSLSTLQNGSSPIGGLAVGPVFAPGGEQSCPPSCSSSGNAPCMPAQPAAVSPAAPELPAQDGYYVRRKSGDTGRTELIAAMEEAGWVQAKAARLLGLTPRQIAYALKKHDIEIRRI